MEFRTWDDATDEIGKWIEMQEEDSEPHDESWESKNFNHGEKLLFPLQIFYHL